MELKYQSLVYKTIPISQALGWKICRLTQNAIECDVALQPNINIHQTGFAGSLFAVSMATGWTLLKCWADSNEFITELVAAEASIQYIKPVEQDFKCLASIEQHTEDFQKLTHRLTAKRSCNYPLKVDIRSQNETCAILTVQFVFKMT